MKTTEDLLLRANALEAAINICGSIIRKAPKGTLRCQFTRGKWRYYRRYGKKQIKRSDIKKSTQKYRYLKEDERELAIRLAEKDHAVKLRRICEKELKVIRQFLGKYDPHAVNEYLDAINPGRKLLLEPVCSLDEVLDKAWSITADQSFSMYGDRLTFLTKRGEYVRSKSELIIANYLYDHGYYYKYEAALHLQNTHKTVFPDFTIWAKTGEIMYWEHAGMVDDPEYMENFVNKINNYKADGILIGKDLIVSFETRKQPLQTETIEALAEYYLS